MCAYLYIHNKYTQYAYIYKQKLLFWMRLIVINHLTALVWTYRASNTWWWKKYEMTVIFQCFCIFLTKHCVPQESLIYNILKHSFSSHLILFQSQKFCKRTYRFLGEHKHFCKRMQKFYEWSKFLRGTQKYKNVFFFKFFPHYPVYLNVEGKLYFNAFAFAYNTFVFSHKIFHF